MLISPPVMPPVALTVSTPPEVNVSCAALETAVRPPPVFMVREFTVPLPNTWFALRPTFEVVFSTLYKPPEISVLLSGRKPSPLE